MSKGQVEEVLESIPVDALMPQADSETDLMSRLEQRLYPEEAPPVEKTENAEKPEEESEEPEETEEESEEPEESEEEETEEETEEDDDEEESEDDEESDEDVLELTEEQIAAVLGLEENGTKLSDEGELLFRVKVDGEESYVPVKEMVTSFQFEKHLRQKSQKDAEARKEFQAMSQAETEKLNQTLIDATGLVNYLEQQLTAKYTPEHLNQLRATKPDEWAAVNQEIQNQGQQIQQIKAGMRQAIQAQQAKAAEETKSRMANYVEEQTEKLYAALPSWMDQEVAATEFTAMKDAAIESYGFTEEELLKVNDHRVIRMMLDAVKGATVSKKMPSGNPLKKRLKKVPKVIKSGSPKTVQTAAKRKQRAIRDQKKLRIKQEKGSISSIADLLVDRM